MPFDPDQPYSIVSNGNVYQTYQQGAAFYRSDSLAQLSGIPSNASLSTKILTAHAAEHAALNDSLTASRSLIFADSGEVLKCTHATVAIVLTIESDATSGWSGNETIAAYQGGAAAVSFAAGSGVTLRGTAPFSSQYAINGVHRVGANEWAYL